MLNIDLMRGLAMIFVVVGHILEFSVHADSYPRAFMLIVQMPLFFVVSGFLAYKNTTEIDFCKEWKHLLKRFQTLLVPLFSFSFLYFLVKENLNLWMNNYIWGGYWFFLCLLWIDVFNFLISCLSRKFNFCFLSDLFCYIVVYLLIIFLKIHDVNFHGFLPIQNIMYYYPSFVFGFLIRKYENFQKYVLSDSCYFLGFILLMVAWYLFNSQSFLIYFIGGIGGVIVFWQLFMNIESLNWWVKILSKVGQNTLSIYAIHYFFITELPVSIQNMVDVPMSFFIQFLIAIPYMIIVIVLCLIVDYVLSFNKYTQLIFWGKIKKS